MTPIQGSNHHDQAWTTDTCIWRQRFFAWAVFCRTPGDYTEEQAAVILSRHWAQGKAFVPSGGILGNLPLEEV